jgi:hypothetical protein
MGIALLLLATTQLHKESGDSAVSIVTHYRLDDRGVGVPSPGGVKNVFSSSSRPLLGPTQTRIQWVIGILSQGVKSRVHEVDSSPPTCAKVKKMWIYTSIPSYIFIA